MGFCVVETYHTPLSSLVTRGGEESSAARDKNIQRDTAKNAYCYPFYVALEFILKLIYSKRPERSEKGKLFN